MREQDQQNPDKADADTDLNGKLKKRLLIAGGLVAVALAAIPLTDSFNKPKVEMTASSQSPSSGKIIKPASSAPAETPAATPAVASAPTPDSSAPAAEAAGAPRSPSAASPSAPDLDKTPAVVNNRPAPRAQEHAQGAAAPHAQAPAAKNAAAPSERTATPVAAPQPAPMAKSAAAPSDKAATPAAPPAKESPNKARPAGTSIGYQVQLGLFSSIGNAEKLVKELKQHGIPAHTVTRVQVGPFKSRAEADETMEKLRGLGYAPLLAPANQ
ncbi:MULTISPECIES: SPOR domain-containing protein [Chromobacterium]|uniref:SPOR domain-containing protein n=2 Tax=Chromobacterium aquaticum TaxID=467180 RepID=A0ABV8ZYP8_9NEIS|nr:SPOR domain-containing protein [Chromobacterium sp. LK1]KMN36277.1 hypothetical protein VI26_07080 [Chromobacterium sp. LK1]